MDHYNVVHRGLNLHVCMYCDKSFGFKLNLSKHEKSEHSLDNVERKYGNVTVTEQNLAELYDQSQETSQNPNKPSSGGRAVKRGRPKKEKSEKNHSTSQKISKRKRGRPRKLADFIDNDNEIEDEYPEKFL